MSDQKCCMLLEAAGGFISGKSSSSQTVECQIRNVVCCWRLLEAAGGFISGKSSCHSCWISDRIGCLLLEAAAGFVIRYWTLDRRSWSSSHALGCSIEWLIVFSIACPGLHHSPRMSDLIGSRLHRTLSDVRSDGQWSSSMALRCSI